MPDLANRRGAVFHQDNASPHTSVVTRQNLWELGLEVLMHPPCSPDLAPSDYHLFLAFQNFLSDKKLGSREDFENRLLEFFANKGKDFYERDIMKHCEATRTISMGSRNFESWSCDESDTSSSTPSPNVHTTVQRASDPLHGGLQWHSTLSYHKPATNL
ncbi:histone-lysine N-methyltransferase SETMAR [Trichonephila clavipes]|nr:histone-lysine N-methyltransferase SETMAR [Trichonephila clavipes]